MSLSSSMSLQTVMLKIKRLVSTNPKAHGMMSFAGVTQQSTSVNTVKKATSLLSKEPLSTGKTKILKAAMSEPQKFARLMLSLSLVEEVANQKRQHKSTVCKDILTEEIGVSMGLVSSGILSREIEDIRKCLHLCLFDITEFSFKENLEEALYWYHDHVCRSVSSIHSPLSSDLKKPCLEKIKSCRLALPSQTYLSNRDISVLESVLKRIECIVC